VIIVLVAGRSAAPGQLRVRLRAVAVTVGSLAGEGACPCVPTAPGRAAADAGRGPTGPPRARWAGAERSAAGPADADEEPDVPVSAVARPSAWGPARDNPSAKAAAPTLALLLVSDTTTPLVVARKPAVETVSMLDGGNQLVSFRGHRLFKFGQIRRVVMYLCSYAVKRLRIYAITYRHYPPFNLCMLRT
jgi:hypothetical protein